MIDVLLILATALISVTILICVINFLLINKRPEDNLQNAYNKGYKDGREMLSVINKDKKKKKNKF